MERGKHVKYSWCSLKASRGRGGRGRVDRLQHPARPSYCLGPSLVSLGLASHCSCSLLFHEAPCSRCFVFHGITLTFFFSLLLSFHSVMSLFFCLSHSLFPFLCCYFVILVLFIVFFSLGSFSPISISVLFFPSSHFVKVHFVIHFTTIIKASRIYCLKM